MKVLSRVFRESQINVTIQLGKLKNKFSRIGMIETICVTECEMQKIGQTLNILKQGGF